MSDETSAAIAERVVDARVKAGDAFIEWRELSASTRFRHIALVDAGRAAASSDLDAIKREAAREALTYVRDQFEMRPALPRDIALAVVDMALRNRYPAPVPEPPHVMVNGWRVTWDGEQYMGTKNGENDFSSPSAVALCRWCAVFADADRDVVRVLALREGRGDDAR